MIYEPIEVFREQAGLIPSLDTHDDDDYQCILLNFDDAKNPDDYGGYIRIKLEDDHVYMQACTAEGELIFEKAFHCSQFR